MFLVVADVVKKVATVDCDCDHDRDCGSTCQYISIYSRHLNKADKIFILVGWHRSDASCTEVIWDMEYNIETGKNEAAP